MREEKKMNENRKQLSRIGMGYFVFVALTQVLQLLAGLYVKEYYPQYSESYICLLVVSLVPMWLIAAPVCFLFEGRYKQTGSQGQKHMFPA